MRKITLEESGKTVIIEWEESGVTWYDFAEHFIYALKGLGYYPTNEELDELIAREDV